MKDLSGHPSAFTLQCALARVVSFSAALFCMIVLYSVCGQIVGRSCHRVLGNDTGLIKAEG